jgi:IS4 transposase
MGDIPQAQSGREDAHSAGPAAISPRFISITDGKVHDVNILDEILPEAGAFYVMDRTNNFTLPALTVAQIYKCRWQVELFFRWIKQHLRIKAFFGTSENAVKTQIWIAVSVYVLVAIVRKRLRLERALPNSTDCEPNTF